MNRLIASLRAALLAALATLAVIPAQAMLPENGWYWNPAESGRGFNIEIQDDAMFMSAFVYRPDGSAVWYVGGGPMSSDRTWSGDLYETFSGQCVGCPYRAPALAVVGRATVSFTSERTATISIPGGTVSVVRQDWSNSGIASHEALFGEWSTTEGDPSFPVYYGDRISLPFPRSDSSGGYAAGYRTGNTSRVAVGDYYASTASYSILLDSSTSYYSYLVFTMNTFNRIEGRQWVYLKTSTPTGAGTFFLAHRTKSHARVRGLNAPGVSKAAENTPDQDAVDALRATRSPDKPGNLFVLEGLTLDRVQQRARDLASRLEEARRPETGS